MQLSEEADALAWDAAYSLLGFETEGGYRIEQLGPVSTELGGKLRTLAIIALLTDGDSEKFLHVLVRSGRVREGFLARLHRAQAIDHDLASGRTGGLLDALASGDLELAQRIAWLSPRQWQAEREYEDDYCWAQILHRLVHGVRSASAYVPLVKRFAEVVGDEECARLALARSFVACDQSAFDRGFDMLLAERQEMIRVDIARHQLVTPQVAAERSVFIEGLAVLRLAEGLGLATEHDYLYCPANARLAMRTPVPEA